MKTKLMLTVVAIASSSLVNGASYLLSAGSGSTGSGITDLADRAFRNSTAAGDAFTGTNGGTSAGPGVLAVGVFSTDGLANLSSASLIAAFAQYGNTSTFASAGTSGNRGLFSFTTPAIAVTGSEFVGDNMYLFAGNGTSFANSTQFLVLKNTRLFLAADDASPTAIAISFAAGSTLLFGANEANVFTTSSDASTTAGWSMVAPVPEPSAALLGAIGALGLLRRRRN
jgi:hypothetical protein